MSEVHETPIDADSVEYEPPTVEELDTSDGPAVTAAGGFQVICSHFTRF